MVEEKFRIRFVRRLIVLAALVLVQGCSTLAKQSETGVVVARRAQIRSSTAVVAADLLEVNRGDTVDILDFKDVAGPHGQFEEERWLRVQAHDEDSTEGWIESRNVMPDEVLQASKNLQKKTTACPRRRPVNLERAPTCGLLPTAPATRTS